MMTVLSYILAAIVPVLLFILITFLKKRKRFKKNTELFWTNQNNKALSNLQIDKLEKVPVPYNFISEFESLQTNLQVVSLAMDFKLLSHIKKNPGINKEQIIKYMDFSERPVNAFLEVLLASDVIKHFENGFILTERAKMYLLEDSPFFQPLPPATIAKRFLKVAKSGVVKGAVNKWNKGKSSTPANWALKQHEYSFPLGFALSNLNLVKGENILDVAGGSGAVCIALASMDPSLKLKMIELPQSITLAEKIISQYKLSDQIKCIGMDMFNNDWPENNDVVLFTNIFHDWDESRCQILAEKAIKSLRPGGIVLLQEALLSETEPGPLWTAHWSMAMALVMQGKQFHFSQLKNILESAGFKDIKSQPLLGYYSTISGTK